MAEGLTLKGWKLGKKLGAGACSDVYEAEPVTPLAGSEANGRSFVAKVSALPSLPAAKLKNKKRKKTPAERHADALYAEHLLYTSHLHGHSGVPFVPAGAYGEDKGFRFLVMERLGRTLEAVLQDNGPVPPATAARLGYDILETVQHMHVHNILYVDVKPENFMLDRETESRVYCVDFGISDRYVAATGKHKELKTGGAVVGTPTFLSLSCHTGATSSRRDDIESLLYVLLYLMRGDLPWQDASSDEDGARIKKSTSIASLCASLPSGWSAMLQKIRECSFEDKPDYEFFETQLKKLAQGLVGASGPFQWGAGSQRSSTARSNAGAGQTKSAKGKRSVTASPEPKRAKGKASASVDTVAKSTTAAKPAAAKPTKATTAKAKVKAKVNAAAANNTDAARASDSPKAKRTAPTSKTRATRSVLEESSESEEEDAPAAKTVRSDPDRRQKAVQQALAGAAAAKAAAKRAENGVERTYNLRSGSSNEST